MVGGIGVGFDDLLAVVVFPCFLFALLAHPSRRLVWEFWVILALFLLFVAFYFPWGAWNSATKLGEERYPTELWQYVKRLSFFLIGFFFVLNRRKGDREAVTILFVALLLSLLIGVVQLIGTPIGDALAELYGRREGMVERLVDRSFSAKRVYSVAGNPNAWGGLSVFIFAISVPFALNSSLKGERVYKLSWLIALFAIVNVVFSGSRGAIAALLVVLAVIVAWYLWTIKVTVMKKMSIILLVVTSGSLGIQLFYEKIENLLFRFSVLSETLGGGRYIQMRDGLSILESSRDWLLGTSNAIQRKLVIGHGVEIEPIYLLINYGLIGFSCLMLILGVFLLSAFRMIKFHGQFALPLALGMGGAIFGYLTFSLGFFFYQELVVGTSFWLFSGIFLAYYQKNTVRH